MRFEDYDLDPLDIGGGVAWPAGLLALNFFDVGFTNNNGVTKTSEGGFQCGSCT